MKILKRKKNKLNAAEEPNLWSLDLNPKQQKKAIDLWKTDAIEDNFE
jgi:hypothetical protein